MRLIFRSVKKHKKMICAALITAMLLVLFMPGVFHLALNSHAKTATTTVTSGDWQYEVFKSGGIQYARIMKYCGSDQNVTVPSEIDGYKIRDLYALDSDILKSITLSEGVETLEGSAFAGCPLLERVSVSADSKFLSVQDGILYQTGGNKEITLIFCPRPRTQLTIPEGVNYIDSFAFENCKALKNVKLPQSLKQIGEKAFSHCSSLEELKLPTEQYLIILEYAFEYCTNLKTLDIGTGNPKIAQGNTGQFAFCPNLTDIRVSSDNPNYFTKDGVLYCYHFGHPDYNIGGLVLCPRDKTKVVMPENIGFIDSYAFCDCKELSELEVTDHEQLMAIRDRAFYGCDSFKKLELLGNNKLWDSKFILSAGCWSGINKDAFEQPSGESTVTVYCMSTADNLIKALQDAGIPYEFLDEPEDPTSEDPTSEDPTSEDPTSEDPTSEEPTSEDPTSEEPTSEDPKAEEYDYELLSDGTVCINRYVGTESVVRIPSTIKGRPVTSIGSSAFYNNKQVKQVVMPDTVTSIGKNAFCYSGLEKITMSGNLETIDKNAFCYTKLTSLSLPEGLTEIGDSAFYGNENLKTAVIPESVTKIGNYAFACCPDLSEVTLYQNVKELEKDTFSGSEDVSIRCYKGSYAESFAKEQNIPYNYIPKTKLSSCTVTWPKARVYSGNAISPAVTVTYKGKKLLKGKDYTVSYSNNVNVGPATIKLTGKGIYTGTLSETFKILPLNTSVRSIKAGKNSFTVNWEVQAAKMKKATITGYQIRYGTSKAFFGSFKALKSSGCGKRSRTVKNLKSGKTYYVQIRTYKNIGGKTYYSPWSDTGSVKVR